jgi:hypothetical protein
MRLDIQNVKILHNFIYSIFAALHIIEEFDILLCDYGDAYTSLPD